MNTVNLVAQLASTFAVVVGVLFGVLQLRHLRKSRALFSSAELVHAMNTPEFIKSVTEMGFLSDAADPKLFSRDSAALAAAQHVGHVFESLGVLVYHRVLPLHLVDDLMGGYVRMCWRKLSALTEVRRREQGVSSGEWMQWLAERLAEYPSEGKSLGAHVAHTSWRP